MSDDAMALVANFAGTLDRPRPVTERASRPSYLMQFFAFAHLPEHLREVSKPFGELAKQLDERLPDNPEKSTALRKLLEAKDCAVRAVLFK